MTTKDQNLVNEINVSAPIYIPAIDSLAINLVPADLVYRLEEYRADASRWEATFWTLMGAIIGVIINWVTSEPIIITKTSIIVIIFLAVMAILIGIAVRDYRKRADAIKNQILSREKSISPAILRETASSLVPSGEVPSTPPSIAGKLTVTVVSPLKTVTAELPADAVLSRLIPALVRKMNLPQEYPYTVVHRQSGKQLKDDDTLRNAGVQNSDTLVLNTQNKE